MSNKKWKIGEKIVAFSEYLKFILLELCFPCKGVVSPPKENTRIGSLNLVSFFQMFFKCIKKSNAAMLFLNCKGNTYNRVDMVGTIHDDLLTQWRHIPMGQFRANIFLTVTTSNYLSASEVFKNQSFKSQLFSSSKGP